MNLSSHTFNVSASPHIHGEESVAKIMWSVIMALIPTFIASVVFFGAHALRLVSVSVLVCVLTEYFVRKIRQRDNTILDGSAIITGMLLAFIVPPTTPSWMMAVGAFLSIFLVKEMFGGLGMNIFNPALAGRAILLAAFPQQMTYWINPDGITSATPLAMVKEKIAGELPSYYELFIGNIGGSLGETSALAIMLGGIYLLLRRIIKWQVPLVFIGSVYILSLLLGRDPLYEILAGGVMLGAFFMLTDMVTTPITVRGCIIFSFGCAIITVAIRQWGGFPEGVCYSILIMNAFTPLIDRYCLPRRLGEIRKKK